MNNIAEKWRAFCEWQQRPYQVARKSLETHHCTTCGEVFQGNYCPRCGQSARIGRYSLKKALLLFLDVWGLGNRGMFRTLRDLLLRPGYMIRDYISGMQMAYFPPFKLLFLLTAVLLVVESGVNLKDTGLWGTTTEQTASDSTNTTVKEDVKDEPTQEQAKERTFEEAGYWVSKKVEAFAEKYPNATKLLLLLTMTVFIYFLIRKNPAIPDLRFSEALVAMVYSWDMVSIYKIVFTFLGFPVDDMIQLSLLIIPLKQMTGFKWWRAFLVVLLSYLYVITLVFAAVIAGYYVMG